jgi:hypothetical protein
MAGIILTGSHPKNLWPGVKKVWGREDAQHQMEYPDLFEVGKSNKNYEEHFQVTGFGQLPVKDEGASVSFDSETQGYVTRLTNVTYGLGYIVSREEIEDGQYSAVSGRRAMALNFAMNQTMETIGANVYNRAFNSSYTGGDSKELVATDHPSKSGNQSNLLTAANISETAIEDMLITIANTTNDRGHNINLAPLCLLVSTSDYFEATRIMSSVLQNDTSNNAVNAIKVTGMLPEGVKQNHYFTDTNAWFIRTRVPKGTGMVWYWRRRPDFSRDNEFNTENALAKVTCRNTQGWIDWRGAFGNAGA